MSIQIEIEWALSASVSISTLYLIDYPFRHLQEHILQIARFLAEGKDGQTGGDHFGQELPEGFIVAGEVEADGVVGHLGFLPGDEAGDGIGAEQEFLYRLQVTQNLHLDEPVSAELLFHLGHVAVGD